MIKTYFTRKNLVRLSLSFFYSFTLIFTGLCIEGSHTLASRKNPILAIANVMNFKSIECGLTGFLLVIFVAIYITVFIGLFLYERQWAIINNKKQFGTKMIITYSLSLLACAVLSLGVGIIIQRPLNAENLGNVMTFLGQTLFLGTIIYLGLFAFIGGILMFIINYWLIDKPFKSADNTEIPDMSDDDDQSADVTANFDDARLNATGTSGVAAGIGGIASSTDGGSVKEVEKLDDREKVFPALSIIDTEYDGYAVEKIPTDHLSLEELATQFRNYLAKEEKLYFDIDTIRFFISGFSASHFMILEGLSGTGKSSLPRYFAKFINANVLFIPVQATWRDKTSLIGYFNDFSKIYSETEFLTTLYHGNYNPDMIHIYVLDEMNISRVEYYFADFLSVLEYPEEDWKLKIMQLPYDFIPPAKLDNGVLQISSNSYFVGTANKDDSTFTITDKVYDRAITIDFDYLNQPFNVDGEVKTINLSDSELKKLYKAALNNEAYQLTKNDLDKFNTICDFIYDQFDIAFGNRILNQIISVVPVFVACGGKKEDAIDFLLSRKVISKIEGRFEEYVKAALKDLLVLIEKTYGTSVLKRSEKTIQSIMRRL